MVRGGARKRASVEQRTRTKKSPDRFKAGSGSARLVITKTVNPSAAYDSRTAAARNVMRTVLFGEPTQNLMLQAALVSHLCPSSQRLEIVHGGLKPSTDQGISHGNM